MGHDHQQVTNLILNQRPHSMTKPFRNFDKTINQALADWNISGAAVAVVKGDTVLHSGGYGFSDL